MSNPLDKTIGEISNLILKTPTSSDRNTLCDAHILLKAFPLQWSPSELFTDMCDSIDASVFSGDLLQDENRRKEFKEFVDRWHRALAEFSGT